jgi:hypothetical protein
LIFLKRARRRSWENVAQQHPDGRRFARPLGPRKPKTWPRGTARFSPSTAAMGAPRYFLRSARVSMIGSSGTKKVLDAKGRVPCTGRARVLHFPCCPTLLRFVRKGNPMAKASNSVAPTHDLAFKDAARGVLLAHFHKMMDNRRYARGREHRGLCTKCASAPAATGRPCPCSPKVFSKTEYQTLDKQGRRHHRRAWRGARFGRSDDYLRGVRDPAAAQTRLTRRRLIERLSKQRDKNRKKLVKALRQIGQGKVRPALFEDSGPRRSAKKEAPAPSAAT